MCTTRVASDIVVVVVVVVVNVVVVVVVVVVYGDGVGFVKFLNSILL